MCTTNLWYCHATNLYFDFTNLKPDSSSDRLVIVNQNLIQLLILVMDFSILRGVIPLEKQNKTKENMEIRSTKWRQEQHLEQDSNHFKMKYVYILMSHNFVINSYWTIIINYVSFCKGDIFCYNFTWSLTGERHKWIHHHHRPMQSFMKVIKYPLHCTSYSCKECFWIINMSIKFFIITVIWF